MLPLLAALPLLAPAQQLPNAPAPPVPIQAASPPQPAGYQRPTGEETRHDIVADSLGPCSLTLNLFTTAIHPLHDD